MIGQAIHKILSLNITDVDGISFDRVYPIIIPQNTNTDAYGQNEFGYPSIIYQPITSFVTSKDQEPNSLNVKVQITIVSESYKTTELLSRKVRDILDHYVDNSTLGLAGVPGYKDENGYRHNIIENTDINHIFFLDEDEEFNEDLFTYSRYMTFDCFCYYTINRMSYDSTTTSPLTMSLDCSTNGLMKYSLTSEGNTANGDQITYLYNKLASSKIPTWPSGSLSSKPYFQAILLSNKPRYYDGTSAETKPYAEFKQINSSGAYAQEILQYINSSGSGIQFGWPWGIMVVYVYKPITSKAHLSGQYSIAGTINMEITHEISASENVLININTSGKSTTYPSDKETLVSKPDSKSTYWDADYHFLCVSLCGGKSFAGGDKNGVGWFEYFNSNLNKKLTTGQILNQNAISGNTTTIAHQNKWGTIGSVVQEGECTFRLYECLVFTPQEKTTHLNDYDTAPFQPTDIVYAEVKKYIYAKYPRLNRND